MRLPNSLLVVALLLACASSVAATEEAPLPVRNLSPVAQLYGLPRASGAEVLSAGYELSFATEVSNNFTSAGKDRAFAFFDGETLIMSYGYRRSIAPGFEVSVELPYVTHHGGITDAFIDSFHDALKLRDGGRKQARRNQIDYFIHYDGKTYADFQNDRRQLGDVRLQGGYQLSHSHDRALALRAQIKLPTGKLSNLSGSGALDLALWMNFSSRQLFGSLPLGFTFNGGVAYLGNGDLAPAAQNHAVGFGHVGLNYRFSDRFTVLGQLDGHSRLIDAKLDQLGGAALQGSVGARFHFNQQLWGEFGVVEDLKSNSSSDVVFQVIIGARL